jgi:hypothetical protein
MNINFLSTRLLTFTSLSLLFISCDRGKNQSIEITQKSQVQFVLKDHSDNPLIRLFQFEIQKELGTLAGLNPNSTWLDFANRLAKEDPNTNYEWISQSTPETDVYLVAFSDKIGWGHRWEVNIKTKIVKYINLDEYLSCKYGLSRLDKDTLFEVTSLTQNAISNQYKVRNHKKKEIVYLIKGKIKNKTGKPLTNAKLTGHLKIIYKDKSVIGSSNCNFWDTKCGFKRNVSVNSPWKSNTELDFSIVTKGIDNLYLEYQPEFAFFILELETGDPVGFSYQKAIAEYDVKKQWASFKK